MGLNERCIEIRNTMRYPKYIWNYEENISQDLNELKLSIVRSAFSGKF